MPDFLVNLVSRFTPTETAKTETAKTETAKTETA